MKSKINQETKSIIAIALLAVIVIGLGVFLALNIFGDPVLSVGKAKVTVGDTVEVPIKLKKNHGMWGAQIYLEYDANNLSFDSYTNGMVFDMCQANADDGIVAIVVEPNDDQDSSRDGVVAILKFKAKISSDPGDYKLTFSKDSSFVNGDLEMLDVKYKSGKITIKEK